MKSWFASAARSIVDGVVEGLVWLGLAMAAPHELSAATAAELTGARRRARSTTPPVDAVGAGRRR